MSLHELQKRVRAAKKERNDFGGYNYRNAETILAELKSSLPSGWAVVGTDAIDERGGHLFLVHTVTIQNEAGEAVASAQGWAMHAEQKKGMDLAQITGACSTYAKKYALQNLLAIDDGSVDPDATNKHDESNDGDAWDEAATQHLSEAEMENPEAVAMAFADQLRADGLKYKSAEWMGRFWKKRKAKFNFVQMNAPEAYSALVSELNQHRKTLEQGKAA